MQHRPMRVSVLVASLCAAVLLFASGTALAQQAVSPAYGVDEVFFGTGGDLGDCTGTGPNASNPYCARITTGEFAQGYAADSSNGNSIQAGNNVDRDEYIEFKVNNSLCPAYNTNTDLGYLSVGSTSTVTANFSAKAYLANGYTVVTASDPPANNATTPHTFATPNLSAGSNSPGIEQFGINLVANTTPSVGQNVSQLPDSSFGYGAAASGYNTPNQFRYVKGETIASSPRSSGTTCYVISYLFNISGVTPAGQYNFNHVIVATASY